MTERLHGPPEKLLIPGDGPIEFVGRLEDGRQFMLFTTGAVPDDYIFNLDNEEWRKVKRWVGVLHLFDAEGNHLQTDASHGADDIEGWDIANEKAATGIRQAFGPILNEKPDSLRY